MLTDEELIGAMREAGEQQPFTPHFTPVMRRYQSLRTRQRMLAATSVVAVVALAAAVVAVAVDSGGGAAQTPVLASPTIGLGGKSAPTTAELLSAYSQWGPTRGDLADDPDFAATALAAWEVPIANDQDLWQDSGPRDLIGNARVLYAGRTPDGVAAVVEQASGDPSKDGAYIGIELGSSESDLQLIDTWDLDDFYHQIGNQIDSPLAGIPGNPYVIAFPDSSSGDGAIVLPVNPADTVSASTSHRVVDGQLQRTFSPLPTPGAVGSLEIPAGTQGDDTLVEITQDGHPVDESTLTQIARIERTAANELVGFRHIDQAEGGKDDGSTISPTAVYKWVRQTYGTATDPRPAQPYIFVDDVDAGFGRSASLQIGQEWLPGDAAHTVVLFTKVGDAPDYRDTDSVLASPVTRVNSHPLVAARIPDSLGWIVVAGRDATITGYRVAGEMAFAKPLADTASSVGHFTKKHPNHIVTTVTHSREAAVLPTAAMSVQIRLKVGGRTKVVTERS